MTRILSLFRSISINAEHSPIAFPPPRNPAFSPQSKVQLKSAVDAYNACIKRSVEGDCSNSPPGPYWMSLVCKDNVIVFFCRICCLSRCSCSCCCCCCCICLISFGYLRFHCVVLCLFLCCDCFFVCAVVVFWLLVLFVFFRCCCRRYIFYLSVVVFVFLALYVSA